MYLRSFILSTYHGSNPKIPHAKGIMTEAGPHVCDYARRENSHPAFTVPDLHLVLSGWRLIQVQAYIHLLWVSRLNFWDGFILGFSQLANFSPD
jgi:hypothetical protein